MICKESKTNEELVSGKLWNIPKAVITNLLEILFGDNRKDKKTTERDGEKRERKRGR